VTMRVLSWKSAVTSGLFLLFVASQEDLAFGKEATKGEKELVEIALEIKKAILQKDPKSLLKHVDSKGVMCVDELISFERIERDLADSSSYLYIYLFDPESYRDKYGANDSARPVAWKEYLEKATDLKIRVSFKKGFGGNWADVEYVSKKAPTGTLGPKVISFKFTTKRWTIDSGLYGCGSY